MPERGPEPDHFDFPFARFSAAPAMSSEAGRSDGDHALCLQAEIAPAASVTADDLRSFAGKVSDLADPEVMGAAWQ